MSFLGDAINYMGRSVIIRPLSFGPLIKREEREGIGYGLIGRAHNDGFEAAPKPRRRGGG